MRPSKRVVFDGQSFSITPLAGRAYPSYVGDALPGVAIISTAISGTTYAQRSSSVASRVDSQVGSATTSYYVDDGGTSDLLAGMDAATLLAVVEANAAARRAAGFDFIVRGTAPNFSGMTSEQEAQRLAFNDLLREATFYDALVDFAADSTLGDPLNPAMTYDGNHLNAAGAERAGLLVATALATIGLS